MKRIENNILELALSVPQGYWPEPTAIFLANDPSASPAIPYTFRQVLVRGNVIRQVNGQADSYHHGITVRNTEKLRIEDNVIDVGGGRIQFKRSVAPHFFNNRDSAGRLLRGYDQSSQIFRSEVATTIEDAMLLSL